MNKFLIALIGLLSTVWTLQAQEQTWREMPYFLKGYEKEYKRSPKKRFGLVQGCTFGLFIHWGPGSLYKKGEWVMYNDKIPLTEYEGYGT